jgi:DNA-directed RNA polymerase specialized sigma subunit
MKTSLPKTTPEIDNQLKRMAYTLEETAQILGISYISVWRLTKRGMLKTSSALRTKIVPVSEIEKFLRNTSR